VTAHADAERTLLEGALRGDPQASAGLTRAFADLVWTACLRATKDKADAEAAFREVMTALRAGGFARLKSFDGRAQLRVYVALVVRDLLSEGIVRRLVLDADTGWRAFEAFFADDMRRIITRNLPGSDNAADREDAYQFVCESLLKNGMQRLRAYSGRGSPSGFILHVIENLIIDYVRTLLPRRRLPAAIARLSTLDQAVFRLIYWERLAPEHGVLLSHLSRAKKPFGAAQIAEAIARVRTALPVGYCMEGRGPDRMLDLSAADEGQLDPGAADFKVATPEESLIDGQEASLLDQAVAVLRHAMPRLGATERLYLQFALAGYPARDIARLAGLPVETVHKLAQKVKRKLRQEIGEADVVKKWRLSV
jgi:RNA polymerase primary sigma factor